MLNSQDISLELAEYLFNKGNYNCAITEYKRFIFFNPTDEMKSEIYYKTGLAYRNEGYWEKALDAFRRSSAITQNDSIRDERRILIATTLIANKKYSTAEFELLKISLFSKYPKIKKKANFFLGICYIYSFKWNEASKSFRKFFSDNQQEFFINIDSLITEGKKIRYKSPKLAKWFSTFLPGTGQIYSGSWWNGINALIINGLTSYLLFDSICDKRYKDVLITNITLFERYYKGNRYNAEKAAESYNKRKNQKQAKLILEHLSDHIEYLYDK